MREEQDDLMVLEEGHELDAEHGCTCVTGATKVR